MTPYKDDADVRRFMQKLKRSIPEQHRLLNEWVEKEYREYFQYYGVHKLGPDVLLEYETFLVLGEHKKKDRIRDAVDKLSVFADFIEERLKKPVRRAVIMYGRFGRDNIKYEIRRTDGKQLLQTAGIQKLIFVGKNNIPIEVVGKSEPNIPLFV